MRVKETEEPAEETPKVKVRAVTPHTAFGKSYEIGETYEVDPVYVDTLKVQGKAFPTDVQPDPNAPTITPHQEPRHR
jgi:hypothetical protein